VASAPARIGPVGPHVPGLLGPEGDGSRLPGTHDADVQAVEIAKLQVPEGEGLVLRSLSPLSPRRVSFRGARKSVRARQGVARQVSGARVAQGVQACERLHRPPEAFPVLHHHGHPSPGHPRAARVHHDPIQGHLSPLQPLLGGEGLYLLRHFPPGGPVRRPYPRVAAREVGRRLQEARGVVAHHRHPTRGEGAPRRQVRQDPLPRGQPRQELPGPGRLAYRPGRPSHPGPPCPPGSLRSPRHPRRLQRSRSPPGSPGPDRPSGPEPDPPAPGPWQRSRSPGERRCWPPPPPPLPRAPGARGWKRPRSPPPRRRSGPGGPPPCPGGSGGHEGRRGPGGDGGPGGRRVGGWSGSASIRTGPVERSNGPPERGADSPSRTSTVRGPTPEAAFRTAGGPSCGAREFEYIRRAAARNGRARAWNLDMVITPVGGVATDAEKVGRHAAGAPGFNLSHMESQTSLLPREHGAYAQLAFPLVTGLGLATPSLPAVALALAAVAFFLANEPVAILLGTRGSGWRRSSGSRPGAGGPFSRAWARASACWGCAPAAPSSGPPSPTPWPPRPS
jgi:hypothetical protein